MDFSEQVNLLNDYLDNPDKNEAYGILKKASTFIAQELFLEIFHVHNYETDGKRKVGTISCTSFKLDTAPALYRLFYLTRPKSIDFSDMYKNNILTLVSPDYEFVADIEFFKYELGVYISAAPKHVEGRPSCVQGGWPGADNGTSMKTQELKDWADLLKKCLSSKWQVYPGNNFEV